VEKAAPGAASEVQTDPVGHGQEGTRQPGLVRRAVNALAGGLRRKVTVDALTGPGQPQEGGCQREGAGEESRS
jgi:hypothetical protein